MPGITKQPQQVLQLHRPKMNVIVGSVRETPEPTVEAILCALEMMGLQVDQALKIQQLGANQTEPKQLQLITKEKRLLISL